MPTFDEWFKALNGASFEDLYQQDGMHIEYSFKKLSMCLREYTSQMVKLMEHQSNATAK